MDADEPTRFDPDDLVRHARFVKSLARELAHDDDDADELTAQTFEAALVRRPASGPSLRMWLKRVVGRLFAHSQRDAARRRRREEIASPREATAATVDDVARLELERKVAAAFAKLDEPYRTTLFLRYFDDLKPREIAARMHVPVETVQTRTKRGVAKLRVAMDEAHGGRRGEWHAAAVALAAVRGPVLATVKAKVVVAAAGVALLAGAGWVAMRAGREDGRGDANVAATAEATSGGAAVASAKDAEGDAAKKGGAVRSPVVGEALPFLAGVVVDEAGAPVEGAAIVAAVLNRDDARNYYVEPLHVDRVKTSAIAWSDGSGRFRLDDEIRDVVGVFAWKEGFGVGEHYDLAAERAANQDVRVVLPKPAIVRGRIRDTEGRPVRFAQITVYDAEHRTRKRIAENLPGRPRYVTGFRWNELRTRPRADGSFEIGSIPVGAFTVGVMSLGYEPAGFSAAEAGRQLEVVARRDCLIVDVVDVLTHEPIDESRALFGIADPEQMFIDDAPAHRKWLIQESDDLAPMNRLVVHRDTVKSWFERSKCSRSAIRAWLIAPGHRARAVDVELPPGHEPPHLTVELEPGEDEPSLTGRILGGARVHVDVRFPWPDCKDRSEQYKAPIRSADCDADGHFAISGLPAANYRLYVSAPGCGQHEFEVAVPAHDVTFELKPAAAIEARVVDLSGNGVPDVAVCVQTRDEAFSWIVHTDATGTAVLDDLPEGEAFVAAFRYARDLALRTYALQSQDFSPDGKQVLVAGQRTRVDLLLPEKREIALRLQDARGNPVSNARIHYAGIVGSANWQEPGFEEQLWKSHDDPWQLASDGTLHLDLYPSHYEFEVKGGQLAAAGFTQRVAIDVTARGPSEFEIHLPIGGPAGAIHGRVFEFGSDRPMADAEIAWFVGDGSRAAESLQSKKTDGDGRFAFERVPAGPIVVVAYGPQATHSSTSKQIVLAENGDLSLDLPVGRCHPDESTGARVSVEITVLDDATGEPLVESDVMFEAEVDGARVCLGDRDTDHDGRARDQVTAAARYRISAYGPFPTKPPFKTEYATARLTIEPVDGVLRATIRLHKKP